MFTTIKIAKRSRSRSMGKKSNLITYEGAKDFVNEDILDVGVYPKSIHFCGPASERRSETFPKGNARGPIDHDLSRIMKREELSSWVKEMEKIQKNFRKNNNTYYGYVREHNE